MALPELQEQPVQDEPEPAGPAEEQLVPVWLALVVLVLLLAIVGVAGYIVRDRLLGSDRPQTAQELEVRKAAEAVSQRPDDPQAHLELGFAYQQVGRYKEAIEEYDVALKKEPKNTAALYNKGMVYLQLKDGKKAEELLWDVLDVSRTHVLASKALGEYYAGKGQYKSLIEAVRPAAEAHPEMADLQYLLGLAHERLGRPRDAEAQYRLALKYVPDLKEARDGLKRLGVTK